MRHPDVARRWAKEYPDQKGLPMYASNSSREKVASVLASRKRGGVL